MYQVEMFPPVLEFVQFGLNWLADQYTGRLRLPCFEGSKNPTVMFESSQCNGRLVDIFDKLGKVDKVEDLCNLICPRDLQGVQVGKHSMEEECEWVVCLHQRVSEMV